MAKAILVWRVDRVRVVVLVRGTWRLVDCTGNHGRRWWREDDFIRTS